MAEIKCQKCNKSYESNNHIVPPWAAAGAGAAGGAYVGSGFGIAGGPLGAIAGTVPGAVVGGALAGMGATQFAKCPNCSKITKL